MARRSALELLRVLRRRERDDQARGVAAVARAANLAGRAADEARRKQAEAYSERERAVAAERARLDSGRATAGALAQSHQFHRAAEAALADLDGEATRAAADAIAALSLEARARAAFERATAAATRVAERAATMVKEEWGQRVKREDDAASDAWNALAARERSRGRP